MSCIHGKLRRIVVLASLVLVLLAGPAKAVEPGLTPNQVFATRMNINTALAPLGVAVTGDERHSARIMSRPSPPRQGK